MSKDRVSQRNERYSIKQRHTPIKDGASFDLADFVYTDDTLTSLENDNRSLRNSDPAVSEILSSRDLISAVNYVWDRASQPLSVLLSKNNSHRTKLNQKSNIDGCSNEEEAICASTLTYDQPLLDRSTGKTDTAKFMQENLEYSERNKKIFPSYECYSFWRRLQTRSTLKHTYSTESYVPGVGRIPNLGITYRWMSEMNLAKTKNQVLARIDDHVAHDHYTVHHSNSARGSVPAHTACSTYNLKISGCDPGATEPIDISRRVVANFDSKSSTLCCGNDTVHAENIMTHIPKIFPSSSDIDSQETNSTSSFDEIKVRESVDGLHEDTSSQGVISFDADSSKFETNLSAKEKPRYSVAKQEHAFAGAMAGIVVSLCLHPMDTIKTVVQSCRADQKPLHYIGRSIISERGVTGLYRGISSNIVSSAPISAVYTFTYESVKRNLLPLLPKEYHSLAHCTAGGCASIATSFIFTPSERVKQQMQVGSHYRNSWNALIEVVKKGGLPSLYTGWGAVLCRNVPHSAIKFYTYESLKENMLPAAHSDAQANTLTTLVCGGLAGSIASLFTTPFDVVKTRLQTQVPGSMARYNGVFNTLTDIGKHEGLKGLYRGLTPRLVMYMIQGALFFASYESFKSLLSLEIRQRSTQIIPIEQRMEDDSSTLLSLLFATA
ncbi:uncharacterized protein [Primulina eburnea]|uniref:uncharacterized protein isoform X1 n=1 Tax=Primulina eburnea TaxID=1245227 RepID=UPI003C6C3ACB